MIGNVKLEILSERLYKNGSGGAVRGSSGSMRQERLVVRWKTCRSDKTKATAAATGAASGAGSIDKGLSRNQDAGGRSGQDVTSQYVNKDDVDNDDDQEFSGLFVFEFDEHGRILSHTIEHSQEGGSWDKMPRMINVTDWLLEKAWGKKPEEAPGLALGYCEVKPCRTRYLRSIADDER